MDEMLKDFVVEAMDLAANVEEHLLHLERDPDNKETLNAVFRSFHTIKGGAGFMGLPALVAACHLTENLFDALRTGAAPVTPGAIEAGVPNFIEMMVADWYSDRERKIFFDGLVALDTFCRGRDRKDFLRCGEAQRIEALRERRCGTGPHRLLQRRVQRMQRLLHRRGRIGPRRTTRADGQHGRRRGRKQQERASGHRGHLPRVRRIIAR